MQYVNTRLKINQSYMLIFAVMSVKKPVKLFEKFFIMALVIQFSYNLASTSGMFLFKAYAVTL